MLPDAQKRRFPQVPRCFGYVNGAILAALASWVPGYISKRQGIALVVLLGKNWFIYGPCTWFYLPRINYYAMACSVWTYIVHLS